ncbi:hypothetical protein HJG60_011709 [Phyllostomus discolor]|uniref:Uncharacterized protein n=1 Tax=Phyllostomus discolor TaxID=89673 RepID=A0A833ZP42_9CHIR|nr:hypothetical protein HJG60_011709 [Phyllostomus discolor]
MTEDPQGVNQRIFPPLSLHCSPRTAVTNPHKPVDLRQKCILSILEARNQSQGVGLDRLLLRAAGGHWGGLPCPDQPLGAPGFLGLGQPLPLPFGGHLLCARVFPSLVCVRSPFASLCWKDTPLDLGPSRESRAVPSQAPPINHICKGRSSNIHRFQVLGCGHALTGATVHPTTVPWQGVLLQHLTVLLMFSVSITQAAFGSS